MTLVRVKVSVPEVMGLEPAGGAIRWTPTKRRVAGDTVVMPKGFSVPLVNGEADIELSPTSPDWVWRVDEQVPGAPNKSLYLAVPDLAEIDYTDLIEVDPQTLVPTADPDPAWYAYVDTLEGQAATASASAVSAKDAAEAAQLSATGSETSAAASAATATTKASEASISATNAAGSAASALTYKNDAADSADLAGRTGLTIGTVTTVDFLEDAEATITGENPNRLLNLSIPHGPANELEIGEVITVPGTPLDDEIVAEQVINGAATQEALSSTYARQVDARDAFTGKPNGPLTGITVADTGHTYTIAKNVASTGYKIVNGYLTHDQGTTSATTADYAGIELPSRVGRIWADFRYPTSGLSASENLVLIVSKDLFALVDGSNSFADSAAHFNITRAGWSYEILQKTPFTVTQLASGTFATPLAFDTDYQVAIEYAGTTATIYLPDGSTKTVTHANIDAWRGNHATIEHYAFDGSARSLLYVKNWGADVEKSNLSQPLTLPRVRTDVTPKAMQYNPASEAVYAATTSLTDVDATNMALTFTAPASGKMLIDVEAFLEITTSGHMLWGLSHNGTGGFGGGLQRVHIGTCAERKRVRWLLNTLTPYQTVTVKLQHLAASGAVGSIKVGAGNGYFANMTATPAQ